MPTQNVITSRLGTIEYGDEDLVIVRHGMIGFPSLERFLIVQHRAGSPFRWLLSVDDPMTAFLITDPVLFVPEYSPEVSEAQVSEIGLDAMSAHLVYTVVNIPKGQPEEMTLNLAGPVVINPANMLGKQLVLEDAKYSLRHKVVRTPVGAQEAA